MSKQIPCAVLGSTGIVGQQFVRQLADHPDFTIVCLASSARSAGKPYGAAVESLIEREIMDRVGGQKVVEATADSVADSGARVAFVALPAHVAKDMETALRERGLFVFSNASCHRMDEDVPLVVPEVNAEHLVLLERQLRNHRGFIVSNSNCTVAGLVIALKPLVGFGLRAVTVTTFQAISGAGRRGVSGWDIMGNVIPYISQEEEKVERESRRILGSVQREEVNPLPVDFFPSCSRVAVQDGHLESVMVELEKDIGMETFTRALVDFRGEPQALALPSAPIPPIVVRREIDRPQPRLDCLAGFPERARGMAVTVGRIRKLGTRFAFYLLAHNLIRGAAGCSILNAELALKKGYLG